MARIAQLIRSAENGFRPAYHRFTVGQYRRMVDRGILGENDRVELLDGLIVDKMTHTPLRKTAL